MTGEKEEITCVRKHIEAYEKQGRENAAAVREMEKGTAAVVAGIKAQERENEAAARAVVAGIRAQEKENAAAAREIENGVRAVQAGIRELGKETHKFIELFYYGHVKEK